MYNLFSLFSSSTNQHMFEYVNIEANIGKSTFINKDGSYSTFFEVKGSSSPLGKVELANLVSSLKSSLTGSLKKKGYRIQFVFERNPEQSLIDLKRNNVSIIANLVRLNLESLNSVLESREQALANKVIYEKCYMVLTTLTSSISSKQLKEKQETRNNEIKKYDVGVKPGSYSQSPMGEIKDLSNKHSAFCKAIVKALKGKVLLSVLNCHNAIKEVVNTTSNYKQHDNWRPSLLGDPIRPRLVSDNPNKLDQSSILNMDLGYQIFNTIPKIAEKDSTAIIYKGAYYKPLNLDMPPIDILPFATLFEGISEEIPWRFSMTIETGHDEIKKKISSKKTWATLLGITNSRNKEIKKAAEDFLHLCDNDETLCSVKVAFTTWAKDYETMCSRTDELIEGIQSWGAGNAIEEIGDPIELWLNTIPGISKNYISTGFPLTLGEAFSTSPISRSASPWEEGSTVYRTHDKKKFPQMPLSSKQMSWNDIYYAPPGSGKSFKLATDNLSLILNPENIMLPRIVCLDIGFSSAACVDYVRACLPEDKKHLAQSFKLEMTKNGNNNINPFDTPLGCRHPLAINRESLINFLSAIFTPAGSENAPLKVGEACGMLIDEMYIHLSDENEPNIYQYGMLESIDKHILEEFGEVPEHLTWWNVVDLLFDKGKYEEASHAQRYAVPNLTDITTVITASKNIISTFGKATIDNGELLLDFIKLMTITALSDYPILSQPSSFDTGAARIVSLDISSVAPKGNASAIKKTSIMYMTAIGVLTKSFFQSAAETLPQIPDKYKNYHKKQIEQEEGVYKKCCLDEFHRTSEVQAVREQILLFFKEGRKYNVSNALLSQNLSDCEERMVDLTDNFYILSKGKTESVVQEIIDNFSPSPDSIELLKKYVTGPDPDEGAAFLYLGDLKNGMRVEQVLYSTLGKVELWAYTTTREDYKLRETLNSKVGLEKTINILTNEFPSGSAKDMLKKYKDSANSEKDLANLYELVSNILINKYYE